MISKRALSFSTVGRPRGRGRIERFFETVNQLCLHQLPGRVAPGSPPAKPVLTLAALDERLRTFFLDEYQRRVHSETGVTPADRWAAGAFLPRLPESLEQLDLLLLTVRTSRRVHQDGIRFHGFRYLDLTLAAYVGETVTIRYDPRDLAEIRVYLGDQFLCRAICQELAGLTISLHDIVRARNERRRHLRVELSARAQIVESLLLPAAPVDPPDVAPPAPLTDPPRPPGLKRYWHE